MKRTNERKGRSTWPAWCLLALAILGGSERRAMAEGRLHVLLVGDPDPAIRADVEACLDYVKQCLGGGIAPDRMTIRPTITGSGYTQQGIRAAIDALAPAPDDAVLFYFCGHGFIDNQGRTYITPGGGGIYLSTLVGWLEGSGGATRPRLVVGLFDCCSNLPSPGRQSPFQVLRVPPGGPPKPLFEELFFRTAGTFAMVASAPGEYALTKVPIRDEAGGGLMREDGRVLWNDGALFTGVLTEALSRHADEPLGWHRLHKDIARDVDGRFQALKVDGIVQASNGILVGVPLGGGQVAPQAHQTVTIEVDRLK